ncbi:MAG: hypothetical protein ACPG8W_00275 [Candidatus Promineifilaceae bacterium]
MLYTVGPRNVYKAQAEVWGRPLLKVGRSDDYLGGCVFQNVETAQRFIAEKTDGHGDRFGVFGVEADWQSDTIPSEDGWWHHLLLDKRIIFLE